MQADNAATNNQLIDMLYEALFWISEYPNRDTENPDDSAVELAEYARTALSAFEEAESNG